jgi:serine/threonine protein kinase
VVYRAKQKGKENTWRAVKKIPKSAIKNPQQFINEIDILKGLDHPNIIKLYETFEDERNVFLVTEYTFYYSVSAMGVSSSTGSRTKATSPRRTPGRCSSKSWRD